MLHVLFSWPVGVFTFVIGCSTMQSRKAGVWMTALGGYRPAHDGGNNPGRAGRDLPHDSLVTFVLQAGSTGVLP